MKRVSIIIAVTLLLLSNTCYAINLKMLLEINWKSLGDKFIALFEKQHSNPKMPTQTEISIETTSKNNGSITQKKVEGSQPLVAQGLRLCGKGRYAHQVTP